MDERLLPLTPAGPFAALAVQIRGSRICRTPRSPRVLFPFPDYTNFGDFNRRERDSNHWSRFQDNGFQDRRIKPLCHPSGQSEL